MTAPPAPASTGNAYVDTLQAPPSQQAMALWDQAGTEATTQAAADQARFDAALPAMPVVLDGCDAPASQGGAAGAGAEPASTPPPVAGATPPAAESTPTPEVPAVPAATTTAPSVQPSADPAQMQADAQQAIAALPTTAPDITTAPGPAPMTDLAGQADPVRTLGDHQHAVGEGATALDDARTQIVTGPGAAQVQPVKLDEQLAMPTEQASEALPALPAVDGMAKLKQWNLPGEALGSFDTVAKPRMDANLAEAKAKMAQSEATRDADRARAVVDAQDKVKQVHADADQQQQAKVAETRTRITNHQADTLLKHETEVRKLDQQAGDRKTGTIGRINDRIQADQAKVDSDYQDAQRSADERKQQGEAEAAQKKQDAQDAATNENWWDQIAGAISDAIQAIADEITQVLDAIGQAIGQILDEVKTAACQLIDAARDFVCEALTELGDWLKAAVDALIGSMFPELAAALNQLIDEAVNAAKAAVNAILGLTWPRLRGKVVDLIGEENTERLEFVAGYVEALITGGFAGLWDKIQQDLSNLWDMVVGGIQDWLIQNVVQQAILKIATMWNPVGALLQLIQTAWNAYQWLRENAQRIFGLVQAVVDSIANIVAGDITGAANFIEASLASMVPMAISLFADLLGLGGIADHLQIIIEQVQDAVDEAIDKLIDRVKAMFRGGDEDEDADEATEAPEVPTSLVEPSPVTLTQFTPELVVALAEAPSESVLHQAGTTDPEEVTRTLLASHLDAQLDPESRQLTLPVVSEGVLEAAPSLQALGQAIAEETGVSKVTVTKTGGQVELHGHINPETVIARLVANQLTDEDRTAILAMLERIADEFWHSRLNRSGNPNQRDHHGAMNRMQEDAAAYGAQGPNEDALVYLPSRPLDDLRLAANQRNANTTQDVLHAPSKAPTEPVTAVTSQTRQGRGRLTQTVNDDGAMARGQTYDELIATLSENHTPEAIARALHTLRTGGGIDPEFRAHANELAILRNLLFNVEVQRDSRNLIFSPMTTDLLFQGVPMSELFGNADGLHPATMESASAGYSADGPFYGGAAYTILGRTNEERNARLPPLREENRRRQIDLLTRWFQAALDAGAVPAEGSLENLEGFISDWVEAHYGLAAQETGSEPAPDDQNGA
jgi:hypothetical protein